MGSAVTTSFFRGDVGTRTREGVTIHHHRARLTLGPSDHNRCSQDHDKNNSITNKSKDNSPVQQPTHDLQQTPTTEGGLISTTTSDSNNMSTKNGVSMPRNLHLPISRTDAELIANADAVMARVMFDINSSNTDARLAFSIVHMVMNKVLIYHEISGLRISQHVRDVVIEKLILVLMFETSWRPNIALINAGQIHSMLLFVKEVVKRRRDILVVQDDDNIF